MKKANYKIHTYEADDGFMVDIVDKDDAFEAWIYHKDYGIKDLMWGEPKKNTIFGEPFTQTLQGFKSLVEANLEAYAGDYREDHMDE